MIVTVPASVADLGWACGRSQGMLCAVSHVVRLISVVVPAALLAVDLVVAAMLVFVVVGSLAGSAADDPHGYGRIFGIAGLLVLVPIGLVLLASLRQLAEPMASGSPSSFATISVTAASVRFRCCWSASVGSERDDAGSPD